MQKKKKKRICLLKQGIRVQSLVQEDPTCLQLLSLTSRACALQQDKPPQWEAHIPQPESSPYSPQLEKATKTQCSHKYRNQLFFKVMWSIKDADHGWGRGRCWHSCCIFSILLMTVVNVPGKMSHLFSTRRTESSKILPPRDIWQCLETFWLSPTGVGTTRT